MDSSLVFAVDLIGLIMLPNERQVQIITTLSGSSAELGSRSGKN
jgi:hypothetical protein